MHTAPSLPAPRGRLSQTPASERASLPSRCNEAIPPLSLLNLIFCRTLLTFCDVAAVVSWFQLKFLAAYNKHLLSRSFCRSEFQARLNSVLRELSSGCRMGPGSHLRPRSSPKTMMSSEFLSLQLRDSEVCLFEANRTEPLTSSISDLQIPFVLRLYFLEKF